MWKGSARYLDTCIKQSVRRSGFRPPLATSPARRVRPGGSVAALPETPGRPCTRRQGVRHGVGRESAAAGVQGGTGAPRGQGRIGFCIADGATGRRARGDGAGDRRSGFAPGAIDTAVSREGGSRGARPAPRGGRHPYTTHLANCPHADSDAVDLISTHGQIGQKGALDFVRYPLHESDQAGADWIGDLKHFPR